VGKNDESSLWARLALLGMCCEVRVHTSHLGGRRGWVAVLTPRYAIRPPIRVSGCTLGEALAKATAAADAAGRAWEAEAA
jgi:hypothetical protein